MPALETLSYAVDVWSDDGNHLIEILARVSNFEIATAAYWLRSAFGRRTT